MYGLDPITRQCTYSTPCGWCAKWDKKCDNKIGCGINCDTPTKKEQALEDIKSGKGLSRLNVRIDSESSLPSGIRKEIRG